MPVRQYSYQYGTDVQHDHDILWMPAELPILLRRRAPSPPPIEPRTTATDLHLMAGKKLTVLPQSNISLDLRTE